MEKPQQKEYDSNNPEHNPPAVEIQPEELEKAGLGFEPPAKEEDNQAAEQARLRAKNVSAPREEYQDYEAQELAKRQNEAQEAETVQMDSSEVPQKSLWKKITGWFG